MNLDITVTSHDEEQTLNDSSRGVAINSPEKIPIGEKILDTVSKQEWDFLTVYGEISNPEEVFERITFKSIMLVDTNVSTLSCLYKKNLNKFRIHNTKIKDHADWSKFSVNSLDYFGSRTIHSLSFLEQAFSLKKLELSQLPKVTAIPNLSKLNSLTSITIAKMKGIKDLAPLLAANKLEELFVVEASHLTPADFYCLKGRHNLLRGGIWIGSKSKSNDVLDMLEIKPAVR